MKKLFFTLAVSLCILHMVNAQTYYWNGGTTTGTGITPTGGTGTWNSASTNWTTANPGNATAWSATKTADFLGTGALVTLGANESAVGLTFGVSGYTIAPGGFGLTFTGTTPVINIGTTLTNTINAPITTLSGTTLDITGVTSPVFTSGGNNNIGGPLTISTTAGSTLLTFSGNSTYTGLFSITNTGGGTFNFSGNNTFSGGITVSQTGGPKVNFAGSNTFAGTTTISSTGSPTITYSGAGTNAYNGPISVTSATGTPVLNFNASASNFNGLTASEKSAISLGAVNGMGPSGSAGTITIGSAATGTVLSNSGSLSNLTLVAYNNVVFNSGGTYTTNSYQTAMGGTAGTNVTINWAGNISGGSDVFFGNAIGTGSAGQGVAILSGSNSWTGETVYNGKQTSGVLQCGSTTCFPAHTQFVYGSITAPVANGYGIVDLNGQSSVTIGSLESNIANVGASFNWGITNSQSSQATLVIQGGGTSNTNATFGGIIGIGTPGNGTTLTSTNNNIVVTMQGSAGTETFTGPNQFTGGLNLYAGTFVAGVQNTLASTLPVNINGGTLSCGSGAGFSQGTVAPLGTLTVGSSNATLALGTSNSIYFTNSNASLSGPTWSGTLTVTGWTGSNHLFIGSDATGLNSSQLADITFTTAPYAGQHASILSTGEIVPTGAAVIASLGAISPATGSESAGTTYTVTVNATGVPTSGSTVTYTITGINASQVVGGSLTGTVTFGGISTSATATFTVQNDAVFEGTTTGTVAISNPTGDISTTTATTQPFILFDDASFYWNGGTPTSGTGLTPNGGTGTWDVTNSWVGIVSGSTGTGTTWQDGYPAYLGGNQGTISLNGATTPGLHPSSITVTTNNDVITPISATTDTLAGNLIIGSGAAVNLTLNDPTVTGNVSTSARTLVLTDSSITGYPGSTITVAGAQGAGTSYYSEVELQPTAVSGVYSTNVPFVMNGTGAGYVVLNYNGGFSGATLSTAAGTYTFNGGVQIANTNTAGVVLGGTSGYTLEVNGITAAPTNLSPVYISNHPSGSGKGTFIFEGTSNYYGTTYLETNTTGLVQCSGNNCLSPNSVITIGANPGVAAQGPNLDLNGTNQTIAGLASTSGTTLGEVENSATSGTSVLTINQPTGTVNTFRLPILNGSGSTTAIELSGADNTTSLTLKSTGNTFTGGLTLNANGDLIAAAANTLPSGLPVTLNGGTLSTSTGFSQSVGSFTLSANSTITLGSTTAHALNFSSLAGWGATDTLTINGWQGTPGAAGTKGQIFIGTTGGVLSAAQLGAITFLGFLPGAAQLSTGEIVPNTAITTIYSQASGKAGADAIWSYQTVGVPQTVASLIGGFNSNVSVVIQAGHTVTTGSSEELKANNLTINTGGELKENATSSPTPYYIDVYGNLTVDGKLGLLNGGDSLALNVNGATTIISGTGTINLQRIRNNVGSNNLTIGANVDLWWSGTSLYNGSSSSIFNVTVNSGSTVDLEGTGDVSIVGIAGASSSRAGTFTVNGTLKGIDSLYAYSLVSTIGTTGYVVGSGGLMAADYVLVGIGGPGNFSFAVNTGGELNVNKVLQLQAGTFAPAGTVLMKSSTDSTIAILDNFSSVSFTGTYSGQITAQRYYDASLTYNQHYFGSPVDAPSLSQFGATGTAGYVSDPNCDETRLAGNSNYGTVFELNEANGTTCVMDQWDVVTSGNATDGQGYSVVKSGAGTLSLTGAPNLNSSYTLNNLTNSGWSNTTLQNRTYDAGWQLVSNPYLATIQIASNGSGFDNQIQVWNANGPYAGSYQPGNVIAPFQAFMVHKTNAGGGGTYTLNASNRVITPQTFYDQSAEQLNMVVTNTTNGLADQITVGFNEQATDSFDAQIDADKIPGGLSRQTLYSLNNGKWMSKNILNSILTTSTVPVGFEAGVTGNYTITFNGINTFDPTSYIYLEDQALNIMVNARNGNYTFAADSSDSRNRFVLHFTPPTQITTVEATCNATGIINIQQPGAANWSYTLTDANNAIVTSGTLNQSQPVSVGVAAGTYMLTLTDVNNYVAVKVINVNGPETISAAFNMSATVVQTQQTLMLNATGLGAVSYQWNLGNGTTETGANITATYAQPGIYNLVLTVINATGCSSSTSKTITVNGATGLANVTGADNLSIWSHDNNVYVDFSQLLNTDANVIIYDVLGQEISNEHYTGNSLYQKEINGLDVAYLIVMVKNADKITTKKVFITNSK